MDRGPWFLIKILVIMLSYIYLFVEDIMGRDWGMKTMLAT